MRVSNLVAIVVLLLACGAVSKTAGQQASSPPVTVAGAQLKQVAYLKGSNTKAGDHFGCGGVLDGHATTAQRRRQHSAVAR